MLHEIAILLSYLIGNKFMNINMNIPPFHGFPLLLLVDNKLEEQLSKWALEFSHWVAAPTRLWNALPDELRDHSDGPHVSFFSSTQTAVWDQGGFEIKLEELFSKWAVST